ncbi:hypothetical protein BSL78_22703 [Apostichopus japonicus]|uniref:CxC2-like cysteine cluster KDZ transposase-associated domain-containing protein n=1 Tax=Stichopus japonicus TaxID=307972 RepID=A0A2G8JXJ0_STIJA|nr:hypothetical protein BSL78_22703 [Apostichopus japonicus]
MEGFALFAFVKVMSSTEKAKLFKCQRKSFKLVSITQGGRLNVKRKRLPVKRRRRKSSFFELFGSILKDDFLPQCEEEYSAQETAVGASLLKKKAAVSTKSYHEKRKASQEAWAEKRQQILSSFVELEMLPPAALCQMENCPEMAACRCNDCGIGTYLCGAHAVTEHQRKLHVPSFWKDGTFSPMYMKQSPWIPRDGHSCASMKERSIVVFDEKGRQHSIPVMFCGCWTDAQQLIFLKLWPATATRPEVAFHWDLMSWLRTMSLECHASLKSLCEALGWMSPPTLPTLVESLQFLDKNVWMETLHPRCPACPTGPDSLELLENYLVWTIIVNCNTMKCSGDVQHLWRQRANELSAWTLFGLKRWKKSTVQSLPPRYPAETFFLEQDKVDDFLKAYKQESTALKDCNAFQAGNAIHTKSTSNLIDETGLFGAVCRHEMPLFFFNLRQGEQLGNAVFLIKHLKNELPSTKHFILYDIACKLHAHLKKSMQDELLASISLAVPAFHVYGHKPSCQMQFSTRRVEGFALSDGEQVERLWSFMRNFCSSTKEMTSSNRIDAFTDALLHYSKKTEGKMGELILQRYHRALDSHASAEKELKDIMVSQVQGAAVITEDDIKRWITQKPTPSAPQISCNF